MAVAALVAAVASAGCKDSTPPLVPTTIVLSPASLSLDAIGASQSVTAVVNDQKGAPITGAALTWTSSVAAVATVSGGATALVVAAGNGTGSVIAHSGTVQAAIPVTVAQVPVAPIKVAGDAQTATVGAVLTTQLRVRVQDRLGVAIAGSTVAFAAAAGSGSVSPATVVSAADGSASATWTLGTVPGAQTVTATAQGVAAATTFTASAAVGPPATLAVTTGNGQTAIAGAAVAVPPAVRVADAFDNPVPGVAVAFAVAGGNGSATGAAATTIATGIATVGSWKLGVIAGANALTATMAGLPPVSFTATGVAGPPAAVVVTAGNGQTATVSTAVATAPAVRVNDANGNAVAGVAVTFAVASGGGTATGTSAITNAGGIATVGSWTLGPAAGTNSLIATATATAAGTGLTGNPVTFTATGVATSAGNLRIELRFLTTGSATQVAAFNAAATRWQNIITAKLADTPLNIGAAACGSNSPAVNETIDDVVIFVTFEAIDGVGGTAGLAGPCVVRGSDGLPLLGEMRFDVADLATMETTGTLNSVILHEMGHVLGIGTLWDLAGHFAFLANPSLPSSPGVDTRFTGVNGIAGFDAVGGTTYTGGGKVPVENTEGGEGTRDAHWRESVLQNELMTGFISLTGTNPLSQLTIRSLVDLGYSVNVAQADAFFVTLTAAALRTQPGPTIELRDDVIRSVIYMVDDLGRVTRMVRPR